MLYKMLCSLAAHSSRDGGDCGISGISVCRSCSLISGSKSRWSADGINTLGPKPQVNLGFLLLAPDIPLLQELLHYSHVLYESPVFLYICSLELPRVFLCLFFTTPLCFSKPALYNSPEFLYNCSLQHHRVSLYLIFTAPRVSVYLLFTTARVSLYLFFTTPPCFSIPALYNSPVFLYTCYLQLPRVSLYLFVNPEEKDSERAWALLKEMRGETPIGRELIFMDAIKWGNKRTIDCSLKDMQCEWINFMMMTRVV